MGWNSVAYPTGWLTVTSGRHCNLFATGEALTFTLSGSTATSYTVRNYYGTVVATGSVSGTSLTLAALPLGWYCLYLNRVASDATYGTLIGKAMFSVVRTDARMVNPQAPVAMPTANVHFANDDHLVRGMTLHGVYRNQIGDAASPAGDLAIVQDDRSYQRTWYEANPDSERPRPSLLQFPNGTDTSPQQAGVTSSVAALYPDIQYFEGPSNEPDLHNSATAAAMQTFKTAVKAGNASAKVIGPGPVSIGGATAGLSAMDAFLANGGAAGLDGLSFHPYNAVNGDIALGRRTLDAFVALLASYGLTSLPLWMTEYGQFAATYGTFHPRRQARWWAMNRFMLDQYGVPKERDYWAYDTSHGYWDYPAFWKLGDNTVTPMIAMARVYSQEIFGKTWTSRLDFGTVENNHYIGSKFTAPDGSAVLVLISGGRTDGQVQLHVTGASSVQALDCFGTASTVSCDTAGIATVPVPSEPVYVRLPTGVSSTVEAVQYGSNVARWGRTIETGTITAARTINGILENSFYGGADAPTEWQDDSSLPSTLTIQFEPTGATARPRPIDRVVVHCPDPWQVHGTLLDYDLEYKDTNGDWHLVETVTEPTPTVNAPTNQTQGAGCLYDVFHSGRSIFVHHFTQVTATAIRLVIRDCTYGGEPTSATAAASGQDGPHQARIREVCVYSSDTLVRRIVGPIT